MISRRQILMTATTFGAAFLAMPALADSAPGLKPGTYKIDPSHTYAHFSVDHMGLSTMHGRLDVTGGTIEVGQSPSDSRIQVSLDPASVDTGNKARDEHLRDQEGFFNTSQYPKMRFQSSRVVFDDEDHDEARVEGQLTLHGVTRPVTLEVDDIACRVNPLEKSKYTCGFSAETQIKRSDFGMKAYPDLVGDQIEISLEVEANKPVDES
ncbi:YceI family protein [Salinisphaera sp. Q1T1-3]|uniref:YceI family protein n=1 Tax=Salinisphaera sp. Q1T1-3 TaxID=2321229 RepID=UPI000E75CF4E|nr:YceI family protein [Salinisphaera sp. Q1T1-3]RJS91196.1 polyisoprenoid-binding protein [Salinisphaera sp. Q1T1-3]